MLELGCGLGLLGACLYHVHTAGSSSITPDGSADAGQAGPLRNVPPGSTASEAPPPPPRITLTDGDMRTVINCAENLWINGIPSQVIAEGGLLLDGDIALASPSTVMAERGSPPLGAAIEEGLSYETHETSLRSLPPLPTPPPCLLSPPLRCCRMLWGRTAAEVIARSVRPEVIVGADLLYDPGVLL